MKRLKELRTSKHLTQQALADILHVTQQSVFKYEHGYAFPDVDILVACANYFDTTVDYLIERIDTPERYEVLREERLTAGEQRALEYYRRLNPKARDLIQELIASTDTGTPSEQKDDHEENPASSSDTAK